MVCSKSSVGFPGCVNPGDVPLFADFCIYPEDIVTSAPTQTNWIMGLEGGFAPVSAPTIQPLTFVGYDPNEPLGHCEGDCDNDQDCASGYGKPMVCFGRSSTAATVPGCGNAVEHIPFSVSFCAFEEDLSTLTVTKTFAPVPAPTLAPFWYVGGDLSPLDEGNDEPSHHPTQAPFLTSFWTTGGEQLEVLNSPTQYPSTATDVIEFVSWDPTELLEHCQGDCDRDIDCAGDMVCLLTTTTSGGSIPGCIRGSGYVPSIVNFCVYPPSPNPTAAPVWNTQALFKSPTLSQAPTTTHTPTQSNAPTLTHSFAPTTSPTISQAPTVENTPVLVPPEDLFPELEFLSWTPDEPLDHCQGDCDYDDECAGDLVCYIQSGSSNVPGCFKALEYIPSIANFCVYPSAPPENTTALKRGSGSN